MMSRPNFYVVIFLLPWFCFAMFIAFWNPNYFFVANLNVYPDARDYLSLGKNMLEFGVLSRSQNLEPDFLRTPGYPVILAICRAHEYPWILYAMQSLAFFAGMFVLFGIANKLLTSCKLHVAGAAVCIVGMMATDLVLIKLCFEVLTEAVFFFLFICVLAIMGWPWASQAEKIGPVRCGFGGLLLGVSVLIRPTLLYLAPCFVFLIVVGQLSGRKELSTSRRLLGALLCMVGLSITIGPWIYRNYSVGRLAKVSTVDTHNLVYFVAAGPYQIRDNMSRLDAQKAIAEKYEIPTYSTLQNPHLDPRSTAELESLVEAVKWQVLFEDPYNLLRSTSIGIVKGCVSHATEIMAGILGLKWKPPGIGGLVRLNRSSFEILLHNEPVLIVIFLWQVMHTIVLWVFALIGCISLTVRKEYRLLFGIFFLLGFGALMIAPFGMDAVYRSRLVLLPAAYVLAGIGLGCSLLFVQRNVVRPRVMIGH